MSSQTAVKHCLTEVQALSGVLSLREVSAWEGPGCMVLSLAVKTLPGEAKQELRGRVEAVVFGHFRRESTILTVQVRAGGWGRG